MTVTLSEARLIELSALIADQMGLYFPKKRWCDLERMVSSVTRELRFEDAESCVRWLLSLPLSKEHIEILSGHLTVGETYFFRESATFKVLEKRILPELIQSRRKTGKRLKIWSAGCCTGEEPYSVAMLLSEMISDLQDWDVNILATDINARFLEKASAGVYTRWSFRDPSLKIRERYFKQTGDNAFEILPKIKNMVTFSYLNLATDGYPSSLNGTDSVDIIFCRNVLMYFSLGQVKRVVHRLYHCLVDGGWLLVTPAEASCLTFSRFETVNLPGAILYRRIDQTSQSGAIHEAQAELAAEPFFPCPRAPVQEVLQECCESKSFPRSNGLPVPAFECITDPKHQPAKVEAAEDGGSEPAESNPYLPLYMEASVLFEKGCYMEAKEKSEEALSLNQDDAGAMGLLARIYANQGKLREALSWCEEAIRADKLKPGYRYLHATILREHGQDESAILSLRRALYLDQGFVMAHVALGNLMRLYRRHEDSHRHFVSALSLLETYRPQDLVPESEGMTAQELAELIRSATSQETFK